MGGMKAIWRNKTLRDGILIGLAHFLLSMVLILYSFSTGMARFDEGTPSTVFEDVISVCANVLMQPMGAVYDSIPRKIKTELIEWTLFVANSLLWGFGILFLYRRVVCFYNKR